MIKWLITGGAGFIGSHLTDSLIARGDHVTILDDFSTGSRANLAGVAHSENLRVVEGSVLDFDAVDALMAECDRCVHLASVVGVQLVVNEPLATLNEILGGCQNVLSSAAKHNRPTIYASTSEVYGKRDDGLLSEDSDIIIGSPSKSRWSYAIGKCAGEALAHAYHSNQGTPVRIVRFFNTVGPRQSGTYGMVLPSFVSRALRGEDLRVYGDGEQVRCFGHVYDAVAAVIGLCDSPDTAGTICNIGNPQPIAINELARRVIERSGSSSQIVKVPYGEAFGKGFEELGRRYPDIARINSLIGWKPTRTIDDAIDDVVALERSRLTADVALS